jgi:hypothetical protein
MNLRCTTCVKSRRAFNSSGRLLISLSRDDKRRTSIRFPPERDYEVHFAEVPSFIGPNHRDVRFAFCEFLHETASCVV